MCMVYRIYIMIDCSPHLLFQEEDGIRDRNVTGVQTCALPISKCISKLVLIKGFPFVHRSFNLFLKKCEVNLLFSVICQYPSDPFILFAVIAFSDKLPLLIQ